MNPDPQIDPVRAIFYTICRNVTAAADSDDSHYQSGVFVLDETTTAASTSTGVNRSSLDRGDGINGVGGGSFIDDGGGTERNIHRNQSKSEGFVNQSELFRKAGMTALYLQCISLS